MSNFITAWVPNEILKNNFHAFLNRKCNSFDAFSVEIPNYESLVANKVFSRFAEFLYWYIKCFRSSLDNRAFYCDLKNMLLFFSTSSSSRCSLHCTSLLLNCFSASYRLSVLSYNSLLSLSPCYFFNNYFPVTWQTSYGFPFFSGSITYLQISAGILKASLSNSPKKNSRDQVGSQDAATWIQEKKTCTWLNSIKDSFLKYQLVRTCLQNSLKYCFSSASFIFFLNRGEILTLFHRFDLCFT